MSRTAALSVTLAALVVAAPLAAQEEADQGPTPGILVSLQICNFSHIDELNELAREYWAPVLDQAITDGQLTGWGVLNHSWGDEWNYLVWYSSDDATTLLQTVSGLLGEIFGSIPGDPMEDFGAWCSAHKDNLYIQAVTQGVQPPTPGGD
jgi:hypothetical protein